MDKIRMYKMLTPIIIQSLSLLLARGFPYVIFRFKKKSLLNILLKSNYIFEILGV